MSNTTSHILLLIQCVLESCIWILCSEKKKKNSCVCNWILFSEKKIFVSCDCDWKLFSEKRFLFLVFVIGYYFQKQERFLILVIVIGYYFQKKDFCFLCL